MLPKAETDSVPFQAPAAALSSWLGQIITACLCPDTPLCRPRKEASLPLAGPPSARATAHPSSGSACQRWRRPRLHTPPLSPSSRCAPPPAGLHYRDLLYEGVSRLCRPRQCSMAISRARRSGARHITAPKLGGRQRPRQEHRWSSGHVTVLKTIAPFAQSNSRQMAVCSQETSTQLHEVGPSSPRQDGQVGAG